MSFWTDAEESVPNLGTAGVAFGLLLEELKLAGGVGTA
jgi:hypothetical protein